MGKLLLTISQ